MLKNDLPFVRVAKPGLLIALRRTAMAMGCAASLASALPAGAAVVISQVYGGGGNSGATIKNDYIELFNNGASA